jgi:hypothetical protein
MSRFTSVPRATWRVSAWEFREAQRRATEASCLPDGQRWDAMKRIAADYGISLRTLYRWMHYTVHETRVGPFSALFIVNSGRLPSQVTPWEKAA